jgi:hypothetical protein
MLGREIQKVTTKREPDVVLLPCGLHAVLRFCLLKYELQKAQKTPKLVTCGLTKGTVFCIFLF